MRLPSGENIGPPSTSLASKVGEPPRSGTRKRLKAAAPPAVSRKQKELPSGEKTSEANDCPDAGSTCVSLPVGMFRSHRLSLPLSDCTLSRNLPSGEMAAFFTLPVVVNGVMEKF